MDRNEITQLIRSEIAKAGVASRFQLSPVNTHTHTGRGSDAPNIPGTSVTAFQQIPTDGSSVLGPNSLNTQNFSYLGQLNSTPVLTVPLVEISGFGVGVHSAFNGGTAPEGTMVLFTNGDSLSFLCIKSEQSSTGWYGVNLVTVG